MATEKRDEINLGFTRLEYNDPERPQHAVLELSTDKHYDGGLVSRASVYWHGKTMRSQAIAVGGGPGGDYSRRSVRTDRGVRATQKNIDARHAEVFPPEVVEAITAEAKAYYAEAYAAC